MRRECGQLATDGIEAEVCDCGHGEKKQEGYKGLGAWYDVAGILDVTVQDIVESLQAVAIDDARGGDWRV